MQFERKQYMTAVRDFILELCKEEYPEDDWVIEVDYQSIDPNSTMTPQGMAVAIVGLDTPKRSIDVIGNDKIITRQANYLLVVRRYINENDFRRDTGDFLQNMANRIEWENALRGTSEEHKLLPKFSDTEYEEIYANGGMESMVDKESGTAEYVIQIQLTYDIRVPLPYSSIL